MSDSCRDVAINAATRGLPLEPLPIAASELTDRLGVERGFSGRKEIDSVNHLTRALRLGRKEAQGFDFIVEKIDPYGLFRAARENIDQGAADRKFAMLGHLRHTQIAIAD